MEEISLKELILILLKEKKIIAVITSVAIVIGLIFAFTRPKVYHSSLTLMTKSIQYSSSIDTSDVSSIVDTVNNPFPFPQMDIATYQAQILNSSILKATIEELNLVDKKGELMEWEDLQKIIGISSLEDTNLLTVSVENEDPELAAQIANSIGNNFMDFVTEKNRESVALVSKNVDTNLEEEKAKLDEEAARWRDYLMQSDNIDVLKSEIGSLVSQVTDYKASLNATTRDIAIYRNSLEVILNGGETVTALDLDALDLSISGSNQGDFSVQINNDNQLQESLLTIEATNLETGLVTLLERKKVLETEIVTLEKKLSELQAKLAQEQYIYDSIIRDYNLAQSTYAAYQTKAKEIMIAAVADIGQVSIQVFSEAVPPIYPDDLSKAIILIVAALAGGMIGVFAAFFKTYWTSETITADSSKDISL